MNLSQNGLKESKYFEEFKDDWKKYWLLIKEI